MKETRNVPQLRFSGFDDEWEEKKLGEISSKVSKKNTDNSITETFTNSAEFGIISQRDFFDHDISNEENIDGYFIVENDDFVYNPRISTIAPVGPINRNKLGRSGVMSPLYYVFRTHDIDKSFLENYFKSECWYDFMFFNGNSGARSDRFSITDSVFTQMPIRVPRNKLEQQKIGTFLSHVDSLIQAKTKKLESLKAVKKSLLQKCFPKAGEKVPEMRFAGFSGDWKEMKLGEVCEINPSSNLPSVFEYVDLESVLGSEMISHRTEFKGNAPSRAQRLAKKGDVFYQTVRPYQKNNYLFELDSKNYVFSTGYAQLRPNGINSKFLMCQIQSDTFVNKVLEKCTGTSYPAINSTELSGIPLLVSNDFIEQQKIGQFFSKYDSLICVQQKEIDKLKDIKKALLQKMFL